MNRFFILPAGLFLWAATLLHPEILLGDDDKTVSCQFNHTPVEKVGGWYEVQQIFKDVFCVHEPTQVTFYVLKHNERALFIDSGLGVSRKAADRLVKYLNIKEFSVLNTHAHCDHVGLNHRATSVAIGQKEWDKFVAFDDNQQLSVFYSIFEHSLRWPGDRDRPLENNRWSPAQFLKSGDRIKFGVFNLEAISSPGHTVDHFIFFERTLNLLFLGDLVYDGALYLHLPDSNLAEYQKSLKQVRQLIKFESPLLLPAHDTIPLPYRRLGQLVEAVNLVAVHKLAPSEALKADGMFVDADRYVSADKVQIFLGRGQRGKMILPGPVPKK
jgi:glyoxylase-like metal-dependent hydrolase (beta-lactamase superfamily II)